MGVSKYRETVVKEIFVLKHSNFLEGNLECFHNVVGMHSAFTKENELIYFALHAKHHSSFI